MFALFPGNWCDDKPDGEHAHPTDCTLYVQCYGTEEPVISSCPNDLYWNPDVGYCDYDYNLSRDRVIECGLSPCGQILKN